MGREGFGTAARYRGRIVGAKERGMGGRIVGWDVGVGVGWGWVREDSPVSIRVAWFFIYPRLLLMTLC